MSVRRRGRRWTADTIVVTSQGPKRVRRAAPKNTKKGAEAFEREIQAGGTGRTTTLRKFSESFLEHQAALLRPSTMVVYAGVLNNHILPALGDLPLSSITVREIDCFRAAQCARMCASTANNHLAVLRKVLRTAARWGLIAKVPDIDTAKVAGTDLDFLSFEEASALIEHSSDRWRPLTTLLLRTGMRVGEAGALRWSDVDFDREVIRVSRTWNPLTGYGAPKSGRPRDIPMTRDLVGTLRPLRGQPDQLLFASSPGVPVTAGSTGGALRAAAKRAGIRKVHPHMLRHTFASHAVMRGVPIRVVQEWLGHSDIRQTMRYAHLSTDVQSSYIDRMNA